MLQRKQLLDGLRAVLEPLPAVSAAFEAGSAGFGRVDEFSDIDLMVDVAPGSEDGVFAALEDGLAQLVRGAVPGCARPILARKVIPVPAWHGLTQRFYKLAATSEWLLLDISLRPAGQPGLFAERTRHGTPSILFDKTGAVRPTELDPAEQQRKLATRLVELRENFALFANFAEKECRRGRVIDACAMHQAMLLRPLVELLRIRHDPDRFDYGLRYLDFDLPPAELARLQPLFYSADLAQLMLAQAEARNWIEALLAELATTADG